MHRRLRTATTALAAALVAAALLAGPVLAATTSAAGYTFKRASTPARTLVYNSAGKLVATYTDGARSVVLVGTSRKFTEPSTTTATVTTTAWVRLLDSPFSGTVDTAWLTARLADTSADILALSMQYIAGAPPITAGSLQVAGDASYGPLGADGTRQEGADFNDYLGISWSYPGVTDAPEANQFRSLDCSGYVRMVFGYRAALPLSLASDGGVHLPRRAVQMADAAPGIVLISNSGSVPSSRSMLLAGDLVFFDADTGDGTAIDHVGIYLGRDSGGHDRFISSRKTADGPTLGDLGGRSILDGTGYWAVAFRSARRI